MNVAQFFESAAAKAREIVPVVTPSGRFHLRKPSALERDEAEEAFVAARDGDGPKLSFSACIVSACLCDETGKLIYADQSHGRRVLSDVDADLLAPLFAVASRLAGLGKREAEAIEKNGDASDGGGSGGSPPLSASPRPTTSSPS
jgi:hypothetical protein